MKKDKKVRIYEFDNPVYTRKLWITVDAPMEVLWDLFDKEDLPEWPDTGAARATRVCRHKPDTKGGVLLEFKRKWLSMDIIAHECAHAAWFITDYCNLEVDAEHTEQFAYLVGWAARCVESVLKKRDLPEDNIIEYTLSNGNNISGQQSQDRQ